MSDARISVEKRQCFSVLGRHSLIVLKVREENISL
jgi:hypothetical protein